MLSGIEFGNLYYLPASNGASMDELKHLKRPLIVMAFEVFIVASKYKNSVSQSARAMACSCFVETWLKYEALGRDFKRVNSLSS